MQKENKLKSQTYQKKNLLVFYIHVLLCLQCLTQYIGDKYKCTLHYLRFKLLRLSFITTES